MPLLFQEKNNNTEMFLVNYKSYPLMLVDGHEIIIIIIIHFSCMVSNYIILFIVFGGGDTLVKLFVVYCQPSGLGFDPLCNFKW